jgi:F-type H+-transporting ATPase subunit beta
MDELSEEDKLVVARRARSSASSPALPRGRGVHRLAGRVREAGGHHPLLRRHRAGEYDHLPEAAFYMVGTIEEAVKKAETLKVAA